MNKNSDKNDWDDEGIVEAPASQPLTESESKPPAQPTAPDGLNLPAPKIRVASDDAGLSIPPSTDDSEDVLPEDMKECWDLLKQRTQEYEQAAYEASDAQSKKAMRGGGAVVSKISAARKAWARLKKIRAHIHRKQQGLPKVHMTADDHVKQPGLHPFA